MCATPFCSVRIIGDCDVVLQANLRSTSKHFRLQVLKALYAESRSSKPFRLSVISSQSLSKLLGEENFRGGSDVGMVDVSELRLQRGLCNSHLRVSHHGNRFLPPHTCAPLSRGVSRGSAAYPHHDVECGRR